MGSNRSCIIVRRGGRGLPIVKDDWDRQRFLLNLAHFNDKQTSPSWFQDLHREGKTNTLERLPIWGDRESIINLHAFCLSENHFHLIAGEIMDGGVSLFMKKLGNGIAGHHQERYGEQGSIFQGSYKSKTIDTDAYLRYAIAYVEVKNAFELHPKGYRYAENHFDEAFAWAKECPYTSLYDRFQTNGDRGIITRIEGQWKPGEYKRFAREVIEGRAHLSGLEKNSFGGAFK